MEKESSFDEFRKGFISVWKNEPILIIIAILAILAGGLTIIEKIGYLFKLL